ncbi:MAG: hypothetical protein IPM29_23920 [Planctomycetes bacterium]|nr:hypothetical protein [Planctomycetota bacterium]
MALVATVAGSVASPATAQDAELSARVSECLERARPALLQLLRETQGDVLSLVVLAAVHDRVPIDDPDFARAVERLAETELGNAYSLAIRLMVMAYLQSYPDRDRAAHRDTQRLLQCQSERGGFRYGPRPTSWDYSVTQYAALGLRAAEYLGVDVPLTAWRRMATAARAGQHTSGGFGYEPSSSPTSSMTVAGIAILEICRARLERGGIETDRLERNIAAGWRWMDAHAADIGRTSTGSNLYFHYGLERACILCDRDEVGDRDWYRAGAEMMFELQTPAGSFVSSPAMVRAAGPLARITQPADTAFCILFLRRAFQREIAPDQGPVTQAPSVFCHALPADADAEAERRAATADAHRGLPAVPDLLQALRSEVAPRRRAAARAILLIAKQDFGYHPARDPEANAAALGRIEQWWAAQRPDPERRSR